MKLALQVAEEQVEIVVLRLHSIIAQQRAVVLVHEVCLPRGCPVLGGAEPGVIIAAWRANLAEVKCHQGLAFPGVAVSASSPWIRPFRSAGEWAVGHIVCPRAGTVEPLVGSCPVRPRGFEPVTRGRWRTSLDSDVPPATDRSAGNGSRVVPLTANTSVWASSFIQGSI